MARKLRLEYPGATYHVMFRGNGGNSIFRDYDGRIRLTERDQGQTRKQQIRNMRIMPTKTKAPSRHENYLHKSLFAIFGFDPDSTFFEDGSRIKILTAADFDENGVCRIFFIRSAKVKNSVCHYTTIYQNGVPIESNK